MSFLCCLVEVSATGRSLVQRSLTECGVSECNREDSTVRRTWPTGGLLRNREGERKLPTLSVNLLDLVFFFYFVLYIL